METVNLVAALLFTSLFSAVGAFFLSIEKKRFDRLTPYLISLSAGTIFGGVFIHLIFRLSADSYTRFTGLLVILGIGASFILEKLVHWHCHHRESHEEAFPYVLAAGDSVHNILDGVLIATSFLASTSTGVAATVAVIAHKVPKELGDFGVMVEGGFSRVKALAFNIGISFFMFGGAAIVALLSGVSSQASTLLLPLVVGNFVFIAGSDLLPELKDEEAWIRHLTVFSIGVAVMYAVPFLKNILT